MDANAILKRLNEESQGRAGMILLHNGIVRGHSRDGRPVVAVDVSVDRKKMEEVLEEGRGLPGITAVELHINEGRLEVGDDVMFLGVAGDIREHVINGLAHILNRVKSEVTSKKEHFAQ